MNNLVKLIDYGQSYWLDNLTREKIKKGEIKKEYKNKVFEVLLQTRAYLIKQFQAEMLTIHRLKNL